MKTANNGNSVILTLLALAVLLAACQTSTPTPAPTSTPTSTPTPTSAPTSAPTPIQEESDQLQGYSEYTTTVMIYAYGLIDKTRWLELGWNVSNNEERSYADLQIVGPDCTLYPDSSDSTGQWWIGWCDSTTVRVPYYTFALLTVQPMSPDGTWGAAESLP